MHIKDDICVGGLLGQGHQEYLRMFSSCVPSECRAIPAISLKLFKYSTQCIGIGIYIKKMFFYLSFQQWDTGIDGGQGPVVVLACQNLTLQNRFYFGRSCTFIEQS